MGARKYTVAVDAINKQLLAHPELTAQAVEQQAKEQQLFSRQLEVTGQAVADRLAEEHRPVGNLAVSHGKGKALLTPIGPGLRFGVDDDLQQSSSDVHLTTPNIRLHEGSGNQSRTIREFQVMGKSN